MNTSPVSMIGSKERASLSAHSYVQTFRRESIGSNSPIRWVTENGHYGECRLHRSSVHE